MASLNYNTPVSSTPTSTQLVLFEWRMMNDTGFFIEVTVKFVSHFIIANCRYLAVNDIEGTEFHFDEGMYTGPYIFGSNFSITRSYSSPSPYTEYDIIFLMRGIDVIQTASNKFFIWYIKLSFPNSSVCQLAISGSFIILNQFHYTLVYTKKYLAYTDPYSKVNQTKIISIGNQACSGLGRFGGCIAYNSNTATPSFNIFPDNYFLGINDIGARNNVINYSIAINCGTLDVWLPSGTGVRQKGILFFATICPDGFYADILNNKCIECGYNCLLCNSSQYQMCKMNYLPDPKLVNCIPIFPIPDKFNICLFLVEDNGNYLCKLCDKSLKLILISETQGCKCMDGYFLNLTSNQCQQICGDGIKIESECDDNNTKNGDGCDSQCKLEPGFICDLILNPTQCNSTLELFYKIKSIMKTDDQTPSGIIVLLPYYKNLPFDVTQKNFYTGNSQMTQIDLKLILNQSSTEVLMALEFHLIKVENNEIWLLFYYNFTVQGMEAQIMLNYSETRYENKTQILNFTLKGENDGLKLSQFQESYNTVNNNVIVITIISMSGLLIGLLLPQLIGLEMILTMQLIFYSQLLIYDFDKWPVGFVQFDYFKTSTSYNQFLGFTEQTPNITVCKKYAKLTLHKTIIENFNLSFLILLLFGILFYVSTFFRTQKQLKIKSRARELKIKDASENSELKEMSENCEKYKKVNDILYWVISQLCLWCILPFLSTFGGQLMIPNKFVHVNNTTLTQILLNLRGMEFMAASTIISSVGFNHFRNMFLSIKTMEKIQERPEELLYKKMLFIYLTIMGVLIYFYNDIKISMVPMSVICIAVHTFYFVFLIIIRPYKQALRIHSVALYFNQFLYFVFLVVINLINLVDFIDDFIVLCFGYFVVGCVYFMILLTIVRLYYEIRYGETLEKKIHAERQKQKKEEWMKEKQRFKRNGDKMKDETRMKLDEKQKAKDLNKYLIETQIKETQQMNLLEWLERKNWEQQTKEKYFYKKHSDKPLEWLKKNDKEEYEKRLNERSNLERQIELEDKKKRKEEDPEFIDIKNKLRKSLYKRKALKAESKKQQKEEKRKLYE